MYVEEWPTKSPISSSEQPARREPRVRERSPPSARLTMADGRVRLTPRGTEPQQLCGSGKKFLAHSFGVGLSHDRAACEGPELGDGLAVWQGEGRQSRSAWSAPRQTRSVRSGGGETRVDLGRGALPARLHRSLRSRGQADLWVLGQDRVTG